VPLKLLSSCCSNSVTSSSGSMVVCIYALVYSLRVNLHNNPAKCKQVVVDLSGFSFNNRVPLYTPFAFSSSHANLIFEPSAIFQDMIVKAGGMKAIISAMALMPKDSELQMGGCGSCALKMEYL